MFHLFFTCLLLLSVAPLFVTAAESINIGQFSAGSLHGWEEKKFEGKTDYELVMDTDKGTKVLQANSSNSASGLYFKQRIDLNKTPLLHWSWKTHRLLNNIDENTKAGDDFVARIYVVIDGGFFFWRTLTLNYVWSTSHQKGEEWKNPYTSNATMYAAEAGTKQVGVWSYYKRNVSNDLKSLVGKDIQYIDAIAIMTDTDNSGQQAVTYYGNLFFTSE